MINDFKLNGERQPIEGLTYVAVRGNGLTLVNATAGVEMTKGIYNASIDKVNWENNGDITDYFWIRSKMCILLLTEYKKY